MMTTIASLSKNLVFDEKRPVIQLILESDFSKEIRIAFKAEQIMKEHKTKFPIVIEIVDGEIDFGVEGKIQTLIKGDLIALEKSVPHDLKATMQSVVRLTLSKHDNLERVQEIVKD